MGIIAEPKLLLSINFWNMSFDIEGKLIKKYDTESKSPTFQTREFVIEVNAGNYPEFVKFQLTQDRCAIIENHNEGDRIRVHFDLRGREWQGKYFTNLNAWKVEGQSAAPPAAKSNAGASFSDFPTVDNEPVINMDMNDDLPF